jgi:4'-phosphopantetheinyl transferase EntD
LCAAIAGRKESIEGLGIDLFDLQRSVQTQSLANLFSTELEEVAVGFSGDLEWSARVIFSAKEAVVKTVSARVLRFLDLREIYLSQVARGRFVARLSAIEKVINGYWAECGPFLLTAATLER